MGYVGGLGAMSSGGLVPGYESFSVTYVAAPDPSDPSKPIGDPWSWFSVQIPGWGSIGPFNNEADAVRATEDFYTQRYGSPHPAPGTPAQASGTIDVGGAETPFYGPAPSSTSEYGGSFTPSPSAPPGTIPTAPALPSTPAAPPVPVGPSGGGTTQKKIPTAGGGILEDGTLVTDNGPVDTHPDTVRYDGGASDVDTTGGGGGLSSGGSGALAIAALAAGAYFLFGRRK